MTSVEPSKLCWVASYPKSGNTCLRFMIAGPFRGAGITSADIDTLIPDTHEMERKGSFNLTEALGSEFFVKTHWMFAQSNSAFSRENGCIYVLRNPMDVLASHLNFTQFPNPELRPGFIENFIEKGGSPLWFTHGIGSWFENAMSWINGPTRCLVLIYEALLRDPVSETVRLANFLNVEISLGQVEELVRQFQFDELRKQESMERSSAEEGLFVNYSASRDGETFFMNRGKENYFREVIPESSVEKGLQAFKAPMAQIEEMLGGKIESWSFLSD